VHQSEQQHHYRRLLPDLLAALDGVEFVADLKRRLESALTSFDTALIAGTTGGVRIATRHGEGWISVLSMAKLPKLPCLDALKNADFLTGVHRGTDLGDEPGGATRAGNLLWALAVASDEG
jgi:hypothetical protein